MKHPVLFNRKNLFNLLEQLAHIELTVVSLPEILDGLLDDNLILMV
jgi:hypothetical protein